jgi:hypothetical protein
MEGVGAPVFFLGLLELGLLLDLVGLGIETGFETFFGAGFCFCSVLSFSTTAALESVEVSESISEACSLPFAPVSIWDFDGVPFLQAVLALTADFLSTGVLKDGATLGMGLPFIFLLAMPALPSSSLLSLSLEDEELEEDPDFLFLLPLPFDERAELLSSEEEE